MRFLRKDKSSSILKEGLTYKKNSSPNNKILNGKLLKEQCNFCAYTEKYVDHLNAVEVEHFNDEKKYNDDYYNYYTVLRKPNLLKRRNEKEFKTAPFFESLFFQEEEKLFSRIEYVKEDGIYEEIKEDDKEAESFIKYLDFNHHDLHSMRTKHLERLKNHFSVAKYSKEQILTYFRKYKTELSFITAIEAEFEIDLSEFYTTT